MPPAAPFEQRHACLVLVLVVVGRCQQYTGIGQDHWPPPSSARNVSLARLARFGPSCSRPTQPGRPLRVFAVSRRRTSASNSCTSSSGSWTKCSNSSRSWLAMLTSLRMHDTSSAAEVLAAASSTGASRWPPPRSGRCTGSAAAPSSASSAGAGSRTTRWTRSSRRRRHARTRGRPHLVEASLDPDWATLLWPAMTTGARRGELCGLRRRHVDLDNAAITLRTASARSARGYGKRTPERPLAWTRPSRHTLAGVTATALNHTTGSPDLIFPAPLDHHPRPAVPVRTVPHRPRQRRGRHRHDDPSPPPGSRTSGIALTDQTG